MLVDAAAEVLKTERGLGFVIFGDGPLHASLARQIAALGLEGKFVLAGFRSDLDRLFPHLDLFAMSSLSEGLPNVALEALAARVPVVATAVGGTPEVIVDGRTGYLVPPNDAKAMAGKMISLLSDYAARARIVAHGEDHVKQNFSFKAQAQAYDQLFRELAGRRRVAPRVLDHRTAVPSSIVVD